MSAAALIKTFTELTAADRVYVGGKGYNLALLRKSGFPVPDGFCITTAAFDPQQDFSAELRTALRIAYERLGSPAVAVRSSALAEDSFEVSFAGAHESILDVRGFEALCEAVRQCWRSSDSARARAYRREHGLNDAESAMAVVVQEMIPAEFAGVCFTVNPRNTEDRRLFIEAAHGLGDRVVAGEITPDLFIVERDLQTIDQRPRGASPLTDTQARAVAALALRIEEFFGAPQDIEWAACDGKIYLLQSRPITTAVAKSQAQEREAIRQRAIAALRAEAEPGGTVWSNFNLSEVLPAPLPMTWSLMRHFMSVDGPMGQAMRALGMMPGGPAREGAVTLICGRTYFNLSRLVHFYFSGFPFEHSFEKCKADPSKASYPRPEINIKRTTALFWLKLPWYLVKMLGAQRKLSQSESRLIEQTEKEVIPSFLEMLRQERTVDLRRLTAQQLYERLRHLGAVLDGYVARLLQPTAMAAVSSGQAELLLEQILGEKEARQWIQRVVQGRTASSTVGENQELWEVAQGRRSMEQFLASHGHRCVGELELSRPRWREDPEFLMRMVEQLRAQKGPSPQERFAKQAVAHVRDREALEQLLEKKAPAKKARVMHYINLARRFFPYRETGKHYWMMGAELVRQVLLELDRRLELNGGIWWLCVEELPAAIEKRTLKERPLAAVIAERQRERELALSIPLPEVIFSDDLEAIGRALKPPEGCEFRGLGVSSGVARGCAVVVRDPGETPLMGEEAILVCRSTDPGWTPLFVQARGLVLERGGLLSHGAVVAREFGLPAVAGIEQATQIIQTGQRLFVDGDNGIVIMEDRR